MRKSKKEIPIASVGLHGFYHLQIVDEKAGKVVGDSGRKHNLITMDGLNNFMAKLFAQTAGSQYVSMAALGSSASIVVSSNTILPGSFATTLHKTVATSVISTTAYMTGGHTVRYTATWVSGTSTPIIGNVGLYGAPASNIFCGGSFATSSVASNQAINLTYDVVFIASTS
jgi:hypothetical protein